MLAQLLRYLATMYHSTSNGSIRIGISPTVPCHHCSGNSSKQSGAVFEVPIYACWRFPGIVAVHSYNRSVLVAFWIHFLVAECPFQVDSRSFRAECPHNHCSNCLCLAFT